MSSYLQSSSVNNGNNHQKAVTHDQKKGEILHSILTYPNMALLWISQWQLTYSAVYTCQLQAIAGCLYSCMLVSNLPKTFHLVTDHLLHQFMESSRKKAVDWVTLSLSFLHYPRIPVNKSIGKDCSGAGQCLTKMKSFSKNLDRLEMIGGNIANITQNFDSCICCWESWRCCW